MGCLGKGVRILREMDVAYGESQWDEIVLVEDVFRKGLLYLRKAGVQRRGLETVHNLSGNAGVLELLGAGIDSRECPDVARHVTLGRRIVHLRMDDIEALPELLRLPEKDEHAAWGETLPIPLDPLEEDHFHFARAVCHDDAEALDRVESQDFDSIFVGRAIVNLRPCLTVLDEY